MLPSYARTTQCKQGMQAGVCKLCTQPVPMSDHQGPIASLETELRKAPWT